LSGSGYENDEGGEEESGEGVDEIKSAGEPLGVISFLVVERKCEGTGVGAPLKHDQEDRDCECEEDGWIGERQGKSEWEIAWLGRFICNGVKRR
jgi:hypothetical protein